MPEGLMDQGSGWPLRNQMHCTTTAFLLPRHGIELRGGSVLADDFRTTRYLRAAVASSGVVADGEHGVHQRHQTFIDRHHLGVDHLFVDRLLPLQRDGPAKQPVGLTITFEVGAANRPTRQTQPALQVPAMFTQKSILRRFRLFSFQDSDHNQDRHHPVRIIRWFSWARSGTLAFRLLTQRNCHPDQCRQTRAALGTRSHPWDLQSKLCGRFQRDQHNPWRSLCLVQ